MISGRKIASAVAVRASPVSTRRRQQRVHGRHYGQRFGASSLSLRRNRDDLPSPAISGSTIRRFVPATPTSGFTAAGVSDVILSACSLMFGPHVC